VEKIPKRKDLCLSYVKDYMQRRLVLVLTIIWLLVAMQFSIELFWGTYNIEMHMVWHENLEKVK
jgi:TRAP-type C4-dicarboxylate transport system permease small subunit